MILRKKGKQTITITDTLNSGLAATAVINVVSRKIPYGGERPVLQVPLPPPELLRRRVGAVQAILRGLGQTPPSLAAAGCPWYSRNFRPVPQVRPGWRRETTGALRAFWEAASSGGGVAAETRRQELRNRGAQPPKRIGQEEDSGKGARRRSGEGNLAPGGRRQRQSPTEDYSRECCVLTRSGPGRRPAGHAPRRSRRRRRGGSPGSPSSPGSSGGHNDRPTRGSPDGCPARRGPDGSRPRRRLWLRR
jgi:hypothetical protein